MKTFEQYLSWFRAERRPALPANACWMHFHSIHPATVFVKSLPFGATVLDFGAGNGGLVGQKQWPEPKRPDLRMYAYSLEDHPRFAEYDGHEIGDFDVQPPAFPGIDLTAIVAKHVIEHLADPERFIQWVASRLSNGGRVYIEWPSEYSKELPPVREFKSAGVDIMITNFYDDNSHREIPERSAVIGLLERSGFVIDSQGYVKLPYFEEQLFASVEDVTTPQGREVARRNAFWSLTRWSQYVLAERQT